MKTILLRTAGAFIALALIFTAFMGYAHTKAGHPVLVWMGRQLHPGAACPLGYDKAATVAERALYRKNLSVAEASRRLAKNQSALGFTLGQTPRSYIESWVKNQNGSCHQLKSSFEIECTGPFFKASEATLWLEFDQDAKLVGLRGIERFQDSSVAQSFFVGARDLLLAAGRSEVVSSGAKVSEVIGGGLLAQAAVAGEFSNFKSSSRLTKMANGYAVSHEFLSF